MPQIDFDGANSLVKTDKIQGQSGTTVTVPTGHTVAITDADRLTIAGTAVKAGALGKILQVVNTTITALVTGTTTLPQDDTIPQNNEAIDTTLIRSITPTNSSNTLRIDVVITGLEFSVATQVLTGALFQDTTSNAIASAVTFVSDVASKPTTLAFTHLMAAGTTSSTTFKVRAGCGNAGTTRINAFNTARAHGGTSASTITITEISA